jgi:hypothetical protein
MIYSFKFSTRSCNSTGEYEACSNASCSRLTLLLPFAHF